MPVGFWKRRVGVNQLRPMPQQQILELVDVGAGDVPADQPRARPMRKLWIAPRYPGRSTITASPRSIRHRASRSSPCCAPAITRMLRRVAAEAVGERVAEPRLPFGRAVPPRRPSPCVVSTSSIARRNASSGKQIERRHAGGERDRCRGRRRAAPDRAGWCRWSAARRRRSCRARRTARCRPAAPTRTCRGRRSRAPGPCASSSR